MADTEFERRARVNALRHAAELYAVAAGCSAPLADLLKSLGAEREAFAARLACAPVPGNTIFIQPGYNPIIQTTAGPTRASDERIFAHELGHSVTGTGDKGGRI